MKLTSAQRKALDPYLNLHKSVIVDMYDRFPQLLQAWYVGDGNVQGIHYYTPSFTLCDCFDYALGSRIGSIKIMKIAIESLKDAKGRYDELAAEFPASSLETATLRRDVLMRTITGLLLQKNKLAINKQFHNYDFFYEVLKDDLDLGPLDYGQCCIEQNIDEFRASIDKAVEDWHIMGFRNPAHAILTIAKNWDEQLGNLHNASNKNIDIDIEDDYPESLEDTFSAFHNDDI